MKRRALLACLWLLPWRIALGAAPGRSKAGSDFNFDAPGGYIGPVEHVDGTSVSRGYRKPYTGTPLNTVILITVHDFGPSFEKRLAKERVALTRETLNDIVAGIEKNRSGFRKSEPRTVTISGYGGMKLTWSGSAQGIAFDGTVYCVLAGPRAYAVQIQDPAGRGNARMTEAVRAVERMRIGR